MVAFSLPIVKKCVTLVDIITLRAPSSVNHFTPNEKAIASQLKTPRRPYLGKYGS